MQLCLLYDDMFKKVRHSNKPVDTLWAQIETPEQSLKSVQS